MEPARIVSVFALAPLLFTAAPDPLVAAEESAFPEPHDSEPAEAGDPPSPEEAVNRIELPEGFSATVFAAEPRVRNPIALAWDGRGRMWVAENYTYAERSVRFAEDLRDRIVLFEDTDWDGRADTRRVFADDLRRLTSVEVGRGGVWALCPPELLFLPDRDGDDVPDGEPEVVLDGFTVARNNYHNFANGLRWGPDGWLYGRCGHSCPGRLGAPGAPDAERVPIEGGMWRYHPDRGTVEVLTHGTTNPWGHDWDRHGELFFINTVNGHLWHGIAGAHFKESFGADPNPLVYERIGMHADHWHFDTSGRWQDSRDGAADAFGGGHAHVGMMIYQGDEWPERFRDRLLTLNLHGRRTNVERLERRGSGYVARHEPDAFVTGDEWFRGIDIRQGPDGSVFLLDWSDTGECHEHSGVHRHSGRIYRIARGSPLRPDFESLASLDAATVERWLREPNPWFWRRVRARLGERRRSGEDLGGVIELLRDELGRSDSASAATRLRALWSLHGMGEVSRDRLGQLLGDEDEHLRTWAVRLLTDDRRIDTLFGPTSQRAPEPLDRALLDRFVAMARTDESGLVRLTLASTLQRLPVSRRAELARALVGREEDAGDHNLPAMVWYGIHPLAEEDPDALVGVAASCRWPDTLRWIARSLAERMEDGPGPIDVLLTRAAEMEAERQAALLAGLDEGLRGRREAARPASWNALLDALPESPPDRIARLTRDLGALFGDGRALDEIRETALDREADRGIRTAALKTLIDHRPPDLRAICEKLLDDRLVNATAARGLAGFDDPAIGEAVAKRYRRFERTERPAVLEVLASRPAWAKALLEEMKAGRIPREELSAFQARQIRAFGDDSLAEELAAVWGEVRETDAEKRRRIEQWSEKLTPSFLAGADLQRGRRLYAGICASCHVLYGEGGRVGPDLTGSNRHDLGYLLENIVDPGAVVGADYRMTVLTLDDGRTVTGVVAAENDRTLTLRQAENEVTVAKEDVLDRETSSASMMPEGLLRAFGEKQVRDLIAYLVHPSQVPLEKEGK